MLMKTLVLGSLFSLSVVVASGVSEGSTTFPTFDVKRCNLNEECDQKAGECCCETIDNGRICMTEGSTVDECSYYDLGYCINDTSTEFFSAQDSVPTPIDIMVGLEDEPCTASQCKEWADFCDNFDDNQDACYSACEAKCMKANACKSEPSYADLTDGCHSVSPTTTE